MLEDEGSESYNIWIKSWLKNENAEIYSTNHKKIAVAEQFIRISNVRLSNKSYRRRFCCLKSWK